MYYLVLLALVAVVTVVSRVLYGTRVYGAENLPRQGPYILSSNELSMLGQLTAAAAVGRWVVRHKMPTPVSFGDEFNAMAIYGKLFREAGSGTVLPKGLARSAPALLVALQALRDGHVVLLNPEGEMSWDGEMTAFSGGTAWLALRSGAPVVPLAITAGVYEIWPRWAELPRWKGHFDLVVGQPLHLTDVPLNRVSPAQLEKANERLRAEFHALAYGEGVARGVTA